MDRQTDRQTDSPATQVHVYLTIVRVGGAPAGDGGKTGHDADGVCPAAAVAARYLARDGDAPEAAPIPLA